MILTLIIYYYSAGLLRLLKYIDKEFIIIYKILQCMDLKIYLKNTLMA